MKTNPWAHPYVIGNQPDRYRHLERRAVDQGLDGDSIGAKAVCLRNQLRQIFLCGEQVSYLLDQLLAIGEAHALTHYGSPAQVLGSIYRADPWGDSFQPAVMLTGLAGTGKTQLLQAMKRLLVDRVARVDLPGHKNLEIQPAWFMSLKEGNTLNSMLRPCLEPNWLNRTEEDIRKEKYLKQSQLLQIASRVSRRDGVCIICLDEFQFITRSLQSNTLAMTLLLQFLSIGPRVVYAANYSLVRRLMTRRQEDRHRVLTNHLELRPDAADSADFLHFIQELTRVVPQDFRFEASAISDLLHRYTFGIKRAVVDLLVGAWNHSKSQRGPKADVSESDVKAAYVSLGYSPFRRDVEALWRHSIGDKDIDQDLLNPLFVQSPSEKVIVAEAAIKHFNQRVNEKHVEGMLTPREREAFEKLTPKPDATSRIAKVRRLPARAQSKESLLDAFEQLGRKS